MKELLFLVHRIPYPPNKGDKIRSYRILRQLSQKYRVHLGAFIDDPHDWQYVEQVKQWCDETCFLPLASTRAKLRSFKGFLSNQALSLPYYADERLAEWTKSMFSKRDIDKVLVYSSSMAQYVEKCAPGVKRFIDFVDIDSDKWAQYARSRRWPMSWIYTREAETLSAYEQKIAQRFDYSFFVSRSEAESFQNSENVPVDKVGSFNNGVDTDYFSPDHKLSNPFRQGEQVIVFTGAMDYWANVDAVNWFADKVMPLIRSRCPETRFYIVGARPTAQVVKLAEQRDIVVTGTVKDIRPYLKFARAVIAPLRIARGIQNKVLEAMAMARPSVVTGQALEGINAEPGKALLLANDEMEYASCIEKIIKDKAYGEAMGVVARQCVLDAYSWDYCLRPLLEKLEA